MLRSRVVYALLADLKCVYLQSAAVQSVYQCDWHHEGSRLRCVHYAVWEYDPNTMQAVAAASWVAVILTPLLLIWALSQGPLECISFCLPNPLAAAATQHCACPQSILVWL